jgi:hypothetical protein
MKSITYPVFLLVVLVVVSFFLYTCSGTGDEKLPPNVHKVKAKEVLQGSSYTYVFTSEKNNEYWIAINKADIKVGNKYYWSKGGEMTEFTSKELRRTFRSIYFVEDFSDQPITGEVQQRQIPLVSMAGKQMPSEMEGITVPKAAGGMTIAELFLRKYSMSGKSVRVNGRVIKFATGIMKKNWIHIQDGTKYANNYDLAVTTKDTVKPGDIVTVEGLVSINKDIGAGYVYSILIEDATVRKQ